MDRALHRTHGESQGRRTGGRKDQTGRREDIEKGRKKERKKQGKVKKTERK